MLTSRRWSVFALASILALTACGTPPIVSWHRDDQAVAGRSMGEAMQYLQTARNAYRAAVTQQMAAEADLANVLVGTGALVLLLAAGNAHRDVLLGTAALGGTAYVIGNMNLRRTRVLTYLAGVEALNCAQRAVIPFDIDSGEAAQITSLLNQLENARTLLNARKAQLERMRPATSGSARVRVDQGLALAEEVSNAAGKSLNTGREFIASAHRASRELVAAVDRIDVAVARSVIDSTPDLSNVPKVISGLAGMMGGFAPGSGLEGVLTSSLAAAGGISQEIRAKSANNRTHVDLALEALADATVTTATLVEAVNSRLAGRTTAWPEDAFRDCGVAQVVAALSVDPASLSFAPGAARTRSLAISGGIKPYFVEMEGEPIAGVTIKPPVRFESRADVSVSSTVTGTHVFSLWVLDSSPTGRRVSVPVSIAPPPPANAPAAAASPAAVVVPAPPTAPAAGAGTAAQAAARLRSKGQFRVGGKPLVIVTTNAPSSGAVAVQVQCPAGDAKFTQAQLRDALLAEAGLPATPAGWTLRFAAVAGGTCISD